MSLFFRRNKRSAPVPQWASFFDDAEYEEFIRSVKKYFNQKKLPYTLEQDALTIKSEDWPFGTMGLTNVAQICKRCPREEWKSIVQMHFDGLVRGHEFEEKFYEKAHQYAYASEYIGVRVYPNDYFSSIGDEATIKMPISEDLSALLVFDFPHIVTNIKPEKTIQWDKTNEELYEIGVANMRMKYPTNVSLEELNGDKLWFIHGDHFFVANSILELHLQPIPAGAFGSLVGVPHRHAVLVYPIENLGVVEALRSFIFILQGMYKDGPGSITESLFWHRDGQFTILPYELSGDTLKFSPPETFLEILESLPPKK